MLYQLLMGTPVKHLDYEKVVVGGRHSAKPLYGKKGIRHFGKIAEILRRKLELKLKSSNLIVR